MKHPFLLLLILVITNLYCQENFVFKTQFKYKPNGEMATENYQFSIFPKDGKLIRKDLDLGYVKTYWIKHYDTSYSADGYFFIDAYITDFERHFEIEKDKENFNAFTIIYDEKLGNILFFKIQNLKDETESFYLTELGKKLITKENN